VEFSLGQRIWVSKKRCSRYFKKTYLHTRKRELPDGSRAEYEHPISAQEYAGLLRRRDPSRDTIYKKRHCFLYNNQYFELDVFQGRHEGLILLEREKTTLNETTDLPDFITVERDVTRDLAYRNATLALLS
jgi:CYTH domain-containing protein